MTEDEILNSLLELRKEVAQLRHRVQEQEEEIAEIALLVVSGATGLSIEEIAERCRANAYDVSDNRGKAIPDGTVDRNRATIQANPSNASDANVQRKLAQQQQEQRISEARVRLCEDYMQRQSRSSKRSKE
jgi:hypothetical protein